MIITSKEDTKAVVIVECDCGCEAIKLVKDTWFHERFGEDVTYHLELIAPAFYSEQDGLWYRLKVRAKFIWHLLKGRYFTLTSLVLNEEHLVTLRDALTEMIDSEGIGNEKRG